MYNMYNPKSHLSYHPRPPLPKKKLPHPQLA